MKKLLFVIALALLLFSCKKDENKTPGSLSVEVSYYYNSFQGYKPDVGARAYLFLTNESKTVWIDSISSFDARYGTLRDKSGNDISIEPKYKGEAGVSGVLNIENINPGDYLLILASKGRFTFSNKKITINPGEPLSLVKNFNYYMEFRMGGESW